MIDGLEKLERELIYLIVFGPGFGESVVVRVPHDTWIVVDSLTIDDDGERHVPAADLIHAHGARTSCLVLTHPHEDHAAGMDVLIGEHGDGPLGCVASVVEADEPQTAIDDAEYQLRRGLTEHALAAIADCWERRPNTRWELEARMTRQVGPAEIMALYPTQNALTKLESTLIADPNRLSAPLLIRWKSVRLLLGADLPGREWNEVEKLAYDPPLTEHNALKIAHHGSKGAQHRCVIGQKLECDRLWVCTPWNRGRKLPQFGDGEGLELLLAQNDKVTVTSLPFDVTWKDAGPHEASRREVGDAAERRRFADLLLEYLPDASLAREAWIALGFDEAGNLKDCRLGSVAVTITN